MGEQVSVAQKISSTPCWRTAAEVLQGEHEPWERNIWNSTVPLWGARPGFTNPSTDPSQEPADVLYVHMPLPWNGDFEFRCAGSTAL